MPANSDTKSKWLKEISNSFSLTWPIIISNLSLVLINATDEILLARHDLHGLAASAIAFGIMIIPLVIGIGLVSASSIIISNEFGEKPDETRDIRSTFIHSVWVGISYSIPATILLWIISANLKHVGIDKELAHNASQFLNIIALQILPVMLIEAVRNFLNALEKPLWGTVISILSVIFNLFINYSLIFGKFGMPELGLNGAAIGSVITLCVELVNLVILILIHAFFKRYDLLFGHVKLSWQQFIDLWKIGLPIGLQMGIEVSVFSFAVFLMGYINADTVAAHSISIQLVSMTFMIPNSIAQAATIRVGNAHGRGDKEAVRLAGWSSFIMATSFMSIMALIMWNFPKQLATLFIDVNDPNNAAVILIAISFIKIAAIFQIADGAQTVGAGMLRGLQDTKWPMFYSIIGYWGFGISIGAFLAFTLGLKGIGIWYGLASGLSIVGILMIYRWTRREKLGLI